MDIERLVNQVKCPQTQEIVKTALHEANRVKSKIEIIYILYETETGAFGFQAVGTPSQLKELAQTGAKWMDKAESAGFAFFNGGGKSPEENKEA